MGSAGTQKSGSSQSNQSFFPVDWVWEQREYSFGPLPGSFLDLDGPMGSAGTQKAGSVQANQSFLTANWAWNQREYSFGPPPGSLLYLGDQ